MGQGGEVAGQQIDGEGQGGGGVNHSQRSSMGSYMLNSVIVTALALAILLVVALPAAYCLSRFHFRGGKLSPYPFSPPTVMPWVSFFCTHI